MSLDFWADYYARRPNESAEEFESEEFEADVEAMFADEQWEDVAAPGG